MYTTIGKRIRRLRKKQGVTQEKLAEQADISLSFLGHIERGSRKLSVETLYKIANALRCSADELLGIDVRNDSSALVAEIANIIDDLQAIKRHLNTD